MVSVNMISAKLSDLHDNIAKLSHELDLKRKEKESQRSFVKKANKRIEMLEEKIRELTEQINSATQRAVRAEEESENLAGELTILEDEANEWNEKSSNVQEQINMVRITISEA
ncbi:Lev-11p, variant 5 [Schistosoma haematobium]|uniref:Lev-11p, variant 5 n=1 Tax=Schistosoma haematobium TaxID=6185 RepID=A0A922S126_SCHHA|nr:Lev-11p, variant 5 [Schistosoma haematobium]KAH9588502.1 Lev-11p, variant 5 [Schistosoma haematobium]